MMKEKIRQGSIVLGTMISEISCQNIPRMMKVAGYEFIIIDCEHGPFDFPQLSALIAVSAGVGMNALVRIPAIDRGFIQKMLDAGADGFLVPMVNSKEQAEQLVQYAKYAPIGKRGISTTRAHTSYNPPQLSEYMEQANARTILFTQIETLEAVENAAAIASVPGIDALIVGPSDLSSDCGVPGDINSPILREKIVKVCSAAKEAGIACGTVATNMDYLAFCHDQGMNLFSVGSELNHIINGAKASIARFHDKVSH